MAINRTNWAALVDDDGSNTVGTLWTKDKVKTVLLDPIDTAIAWTEVNTTAVGTQNNFNPGIVGNTVIRCSNATLLTITGFPAGANGDRIRLVGIGAQVDLPYFNAGSSAANRLVNWVTSGATSLYPGALPTRAFAEYQYQTADSQWVLRAHEQGAWAPWTPALKGVTSQSGQVYSTQSGRYHLAGRLLRFTGRCTLTTLGTITGSVAIGTFPYTVGAASFHGMHVHYFQSLTTAVVSLFGYIQPSDNKGILQMLTAAGVGSAPVAQANLSNATDLIFSGQFEVD